jgi:hypothetical protein
MTDILGKLNVMKQFDFYYPLLYLKVGMKILHQSM